jgi:Leucine-rich repeat (LRR) protein
MKKLGFVLIVMLLICFACKKNTTTSPAPADTATYTATNVPPSSTQTATLPATLTASPTFTVTATSTWCGGCSAEPGIPDPLLRNGIRTALAIGTATPITYADLLSLTTLDINTTNVSDITGLENCANLQYLYAYSTDISSLAPLAGLTNLQSLVLWDNMNLTDISVLSGKTTITELNVGSTGVSQDDFPVVLTLTNLTNLYMYSDNIADIEGIQALTNLHYLGLYSNPGLSDITRLSGLVGLTWLALESCNISDIASLVANTGLGTGDWVGLSSNPIVAVDPLGQKAALSGKGVTVTY